MTRDQIMAVVKPAVCRCLKSPSTAQFPEEVIQIVGSDESGYKVTGYVDSHNSYGGMMRTDFAVTVSVRNGYPVVTNSSVGVDAARQAGKNYAAAWVFGVVVTILTGFIFYMLAIMGMPF